MEQLLQPLLDEDQAAAILGNIKPNTLAGWRCKGIGPEFVYVGRRVKYTPRAIQAYIEKNTRTSTSQEVAS